MFPKSIFLSPNLEIRNKKEERSHLKSSQFIDKKEARHPARIDWHLKWKKLTFKPGALSGFEPSPLGHNAVTLPFEAPTLPFTPFSSKSIFLGKKKLLHKKSEFLTSLTTSVFRRHFEVFSFQKFLRFFFFFICGGLKSFELRWKLWSEQWSNFCHLQKISYFFLEKEFYDMVTCRLRCCTLQWWGLFY